MEDCLVSQVTSLVTVGGIALFLGILWVAQQRPSVTREA